jgi:hypothetical protein
MLPQPHSFRLHKRNFFPPKARFLNRRSPLNLVFPTTAFMNGPSSPTAFGALYF